MTTQQCQVHKLVHSADDVHEVDLPQLNACVHVCTCVCLKKCHILLTKSDNISTVWQLLQSLVSNCYEKSYRLFDIPVLDLSKHLCVQPTLLSLYRAKSIHHWPVLDRPVLHCPVLQCQCSAVHVVDWWVVAGRVQGTTSAKSWQYTIWRYWCWTAWDDAVIAWWRRQWKCIWPRSAGKLLFLTILCHDCAVYGVSV